MDVSTMDLTEKLMYVTVQIRCLKGDGSFSYGTGFIYVFQGRDYPSRVGDQQTCCCGYYKNLDTDTVCSF